MNLNGSGSANITVAVVPKMVGLSWSGAQARTYDGNPSNVTATATGTLPGDQVNVAISDGNKSDAGTHTAKATGLTGAQADYYQLPSGATQQYSIEAKAVTASAQPIAAQTYTGSKIEPAVKALDGSLKFLQASTRSSMRTMKTSARQRLLLKTRKVVTTRLAVAPPLILPPRALTVQR